jgi:hypothetical protein
LAFYFQHIKKKQKNIKIEPKLKTMATQKAKSYGKVMVIFFF